MDAGTVGVLIGMNAALGALLWWRLEKNALLLKHELTVTAASIKTVEPTFDGLKDDLADLIHDTIGEMRPPAIADHLGGILSQWAQLKFAKQMQDMNLPIGAPQQPETGPDPSGYAQDFD